jgi:hypothetical protein
VIEKFRAGQFPIEHVLCVVQIGRFWIDEFDDVVGLITGLDDRKCGVNPGPTPLGDALRKFPIADLHFCSCGYGFYRQKTDVTQSANST